MKSNHFVDYVHSFYGEGGVYPLFKNAKSLTKDDIKANVPLMHNLMVEQGFPYGDGDSMDREFMRFEVLEPIGHKELS